MGQLTTYKSWDDPPSRGPLVAQPPSAAGTVEESPFAVLSNGLRADQALDQQLGPEPRMGLDFQPLVVETSAILGCQKEILSERCSRWWFHGTNTVRSTRPVVSNIFYFHPFLGI